MGHQDPRVTAAIAAARPFARPILRRIRAAFHEACPEVRETVKWSMPAFEHRGLLGGMGSFKAHVALWLWRGRLLERAGPDRAGAMGQFGRLESVADLPPRAGLLAILREAVRLDEARAAAPRTPRGRARPAGKPRRAAPGARPRKAPGGRKAPARPRRRMG